MDTAVIVAGRPRMVTGPENITLASGDPIKKWTIIMDNGATLAAYTKKAADALERQLDKDTVIDVDDPGDGRPPKVIKVIAEGGTILYERTASQGGQGQGGKKEWVDTTPAQNARHALGSAVALVGQLGARNAAGERMSDADLILKIDEYAKAFYEIVNSLH